MTFWAPNDLVSLRNASVEGGHKPVPQWTDVTPRTSLKCLRNKGFAGIHKPKGS